MADVLHTLYIEAHTERRGDLRRWSGLLRRCSYRARMAMSRGHSDDADVSGDGGHSVDVRMILQVAYHYSIEYFLHILRCIRIGALYGFIYVTRKK